MGETCLPQVSGHWVAFVSAANFAHSGGDTGYSRRRTGRKREKGLLSCRCEGRRQGHINVGGADVAFIGSKNRRAQVSYVLKPSLVG